MTNVPTIPPPEHIPADTPYVVATLNRLRLLAVEQGRQLAAGDAAGVTRADELRRSLLAQLTRPQLEYLALLAVPVQLVPTEVV